MKYFTCLITLLSFGICSFCQTPFEGIIKYELSGEKDSMIAYVSFYFKKDKITTAVETVNSQKATGDNFAIDFSKNLIYHFIGKDKKYVIDTLKEESGQKNYLSQLLVS